MSTITKPYTFSAGATIIAAEHNSNWDTLLNDYNGNITNVNLSASAAIVGTKLAAIIQSNKVRGAALYDLSTTTSTAGVLPIANLPSGASANQLVTVSGSDNVLRAFDGQLLYGLNASALSSGTVPTARLGSGTASGSTYLKGDSTWATVTTGAPISQANTATVTPITFNYGTTINTVSKTINSGNTVVAIANGIVGFGNYPGESYLNLYANGTLIGATTVNCSATNEICPNYFITAVNTTLSGAVAFTLTGMRYTAAGKATGKIIVLDF